MKQKLFGIILIVIFICAGSACQAQPAATADTVVTATDLPVSSTEGISSFPPVSPEDPITDYTPALTETITPTATPSLTPLPTLSSQDRTAFIRALFMDHSCELPCVAGITPGETTLDEAGQWLSQAALYTGYDGSNPNYAAHRFIFDPYALPFMFGENPEVTLYTLGDIPQIQYLETDLVGVTLQDLFSTYGTPDRININLAYEMDRYYSLDYRFFFIYRDLHSAFYIHFPIDIDLNSPDLGPVTICPLQAQTATPVLHLVTWGEDFVSFAYMNDLLPAQLTAGPGQISQVWRIDEAQFVELVMDGIPGNDCFLAEVP